MIIEDVKNSGVRFELVQEDIDKLKELQKRYKNLRSITLPALWMVQNKQGWISSEAMLYLEKLLDIPVIHFYEVSSFFTMFDLKPRGKYYIKFCKTLSCQLRGSDELLKHVEQKLGIKKGETTKDGLFTLGETECLGYCNQAPSLLCNTKQFFDLSIDSVDEMIDEIIKSEKW